MRTRASGIGGFPERSKGSDCKSDGTAFTGSNPVPPTTKPVTVCGKAEAVCGFSERGRQANNSGTIETGLFELQRDGDPVFDTSRKSVKSTDCGCSSMVEP